MKQIHPQNITEYGIRDWGRRPYSGANHAWRPERKSWEIMHRLSCFSLQDDPKQDSNNVHICGEAFSDYHGFIEGALRSAAHALHTAYPEEFDTETYWLCEGKGCFHPFIS